ncbi:unnamed protein product [Tilletia controversa]|nr:unnamed protein product [Tilletia controversa]
MSSLDSREAPLALADCSFDELVPANRKGSASTQNNSSNHAVPSAPGPSPVATISLRDVGTELPSSSSNLWDRMPPSHAASLIYAPCSTLIVARAIHHDARTGPVLHLTFTSLLPPGSTGGSAGIADASLRMLLPAPAVDSIGLIVHPHGSSGSTDEARALHVFILTHGAQLFQISIPLASASLAQVINVRTIQRRTQVLEFITPAPGWTRSGRSGSGLGASAAGVAMSLVLGSKQQQRGKTATQVLFVQSGLMLIACEDGTLVMMNKDEGTRGSWNETFLKPTSFLNTLARLIPRSASSVSHQQRSGMTSASTQLPEPTSTFEPTQILALDAFDNQDIFALACAVSRDRKLRIWGLYTETCLHTVELPRKKPDLTSGEASFGARAMARRALGLRSADAGVVAVREGSVAPSSIAGSATGTGGNGTKAPSEYSTATAAFQAGAVFGGIGSSGNAEDGGGSSGGASFPRIMVQQAPDGSMYSLIILVYVPVPATPTQARAESFFVLYGIKLASTPGRDGLEGAQEAVQTATPLWSCAAADEGEDEAAGIASAPALRALKLRSHFDDGESRADDADPDRQGWTLWTAWNTLAGPEIRKTRIRLDANGKPLPAAARALAAPMLTQEETAAPIWTVVSAFPCPSSRSSSSSAQARFSPLHGLHFSQDLARALEHESSSVADFFIARLFEPGRFGARSLERAADWYEESNQRTLRGRDLGGNASFEADTTVGAGEQTLASETGRNRDTSGSSSVPIMARLLSLIGAHLRPQRDAATGATRHGDFESALVREWVKYVDRVEKEEDAARYVLGFVGPAVCASDAEGAGADVTVRVDMDEDEDKDEDEDEDGLNDEVRNNWSVQSNDPIIVIANNRLGRPIEEMPSETLLRIAREAAKDELADFIKAPEEDISGGDGQSIRRFSPEALQSLAACLGSVDVSQLTESEAGVRGDERDDVAIRMQRARLLADLVALGLSIPRSLTKTTVDSVLSVFSLGESEDGESVLNDAIQEAWLGACELYNIDRIVALEEDIYNGRVDAGADAQDAHGGELDPEAEAHLAERRAEIQEEISRSVATWVESHLFANEAITGDESEALDSEKANVMEQALWTWFDLLEPSRSSLQGLTSALDSGRSQSAPVAASSFHAVLTADGALQALLARRRLGHALLVLLLSLQRSPVFYPEFSAADGEDDPFAIEDEDDAKLGNGAIPSLTSLLSRTLDALQCIERLYQLVSSNPSSGIDPKTLLVAAEIEQPTQLVPLRGGDNPDADDLALEVEAVLLDEEREGLHEPPTLHALETLWSQLFRDQMRLGRFSDAYVTLMRIPLRDLQVDCLRSLISVMCEQGQSPALLGFTFPGLQDKVERELSFKARNSHPLTYPNYFNILHKFHVFRGDLKNAAASMYQLAQKYGELHRTGGLFSADTDPAENFLDLAKLQAQSYLAALNALALCHPKEAWFSDSTSSSMNMTEQEESPIDIDADDDLQSSGERRADAFSSAERDGEENYAASSAKRRRLTTYIPEHMFQEVRRPIHMVRIDDVRREYHLVLARLELVRFFPEAANPSFVLGATNAVSLFVGNRQFDSAFSLARELDVDMTPIFQRLTTICIALSDNLASRRAEAAATGSAAAEKGDDEVDFDDVVKRRLDSVYDAEENRLEPEVEFLAYSEWSINWDGPAADRAWDYLRIHLEMYDIASDGWRYRHAVLDRCLALGARVAVPAWLIEWFQTHKSDSLMRSYIQSGRIDEALHEGIRLANEVPHIDGPSATYLPYSLLDSALLLAEDPEERARRAASPSLLRTRDLASDLRLAVRKRFDSLGKAEKSWVRDAQRRERDQVRTD